MKIYVGVIVTKNLCNDNFETFNQIRPIHPSIADLSEKDFTLGVNFLIEHWHLEKIEAPRDEFSSKYFGDKIAVTRTLYLPEIRF